jgi:hypothetical protein
MEEVLEDDGAVLGEKLLEVRDVVVARLPQLPGHEIVDPHDEHVLIVRAIEDGELAEARRVAVHPPEEVVLALLGGRHAEGHDVHAARIEAAHHVLDRAVLARGVPALQHHHHAVHLGAEHGILQLEQLCTERGEALPRFFLGDSFRRVDRDLVETDFLAAVVEDELCQVANSALVSTAKELACRRPSRP